MPAIRTHDEFEDDDGMPPLVDNPAGMPPLVDNPNPSMVFTFSTYMTPLTFTTDPNSYEISSSDSPTPPPAAIPSSPVSDDSTTTPTSPQRPSHSKKRDASYIPRPPNAFILFRSSFIKSQQVPGKVEGNHSTLSKIIGMYWKTLPREQREIWEAKAIVAQAEHRKRYPDWRFRPGANALAKLKIKDGGSGGRPPGNAHSSAGGGGSGGGHKKKNGHGQSRKGRIKEERCAKIANLLVEGKTGLDLAEAVRKWEGDSMNGVVKESGSAVGPTANQKQHQQTTWESGKEGGLLLDDLKVDHSPCKGFIDAAKMSNDSVDIPCMRSMTPDAAYDRFKVPLTAMFKRSLSAPASHTRCPCPEGDTQQQQQVCGSAYCDSPQTATYESPVTPPNEARDVANPMDLLPPLMIPPMFADPACVPWNDPFSPVDQGQGYDLSTPVDSPCQGPFNHFIYPDPNYVQPLPCTDISSPYFIPPQSHTYSNYSTLAEWAGPLASETGETDGDPHRHYHGDYVWPPMCEVRKESERSPLECYEQGLEAFSVNGVTFG